MIQNGDDVMLDFGNGDTLLTDNVTIAELDADNFVVALV